VLDLVYTLGSVWDWPAQQVIFCPLPNNITKWVVSGRGWLVFGWGHSKIKFCRPRRFPCGCAECIPCRPGYADLFLKTGVQWQISKKQESRPARRPSFPAGQIFAKDAANQTFKSVFILRIGIWLSAGPSRGHWKAPEHAQSIYAHTGRQNKNRWIPSYIC
jgi:hypothetical protein